MSRLGITSNMTWTRIKDMHHVEQDLEWNYLYIQLPKALAVEYVRYEYGIEPLETGEAWYDQLYAIREYPTLGEAAAANTPPNTTTAAYLGRADVLIIESPYGDTPSMAP